LSWIAKIAVGGEAGHFIHGPDTGALAIFEQSL